LANVPKDLQREEWEWLIEFSGTDAKFKVISNLTIYERACLNGYIFVSMNG